MLVGLALLDAAAGRRPDHPVAEVEADEQDPLELVEDDRPRRRPEAGPRAHQVDERRQRPEPAQALVPRDRRRSRARSTGARRAPDPSVRSWSPSCGPLAEDAVVRRLPDERDDLRAERL